MSYYTMIPIDIHPRILDLYTSGLSAQEIKDELQIDTTIRSIQRLVKKHGLSRSGGDAFRNAVKRGRVEYIKKKSIFRTKRTSLPPTLRYKILERDNFRCVSCGATARDRLLEVDHIDNNPTNHNETNLRILCEVCNIGRYSPNRYIPRV